MDIGSLTGQVAIEDQLTDHLTEITGKIKDFVDDFDGLMGGLVIGAGVVAAAITGIAISIAALGDKGSDVNDVAATLDHFAGSAENANKIIEEMEKGTLETVSKMDLMKNSSKLLAAGVDLTADNFKTLSGAAFILQNQGLGPTKDMLELVSQAMLTGRTRSLEMKIGKLDLSAAEKNFAATLGTTADKLDAAGKLEAKRIGLLDALQKKVSEAGKQERDFGEELEHARKSMADWEEDLASAVAASPDVMKALHDIADAIGAVFNDNSKSLSDALVGGIEMFARGVSAAVPWVQDFARGMKDGYDVTMQYWPIIRSLGEAFVVYEGILLAVSLKTTLFTAATWLGNAAGIAYDATMAMMAGETATFGATLTTALGPIGLITAAVVLMVEGWKAASKESGWVRDLSDKFEYASLRLQRYTDAEAKNIIAQEHALERVEEHTKGMTAQAIALERVGTLVGDGIQVDDAAAKAKDNHRFISDKLTESEKAYAKAIADYTASTADDWLSVMDKLGAKMYEGIAADHARGRGVEELALVYGVSKSAVEEVVKAEAAYAAQVKMITSIENTAFKESEQIHKNWADAVSKLADTVGKSIIDGASQIREAELKSADLVAQSTLTSTNYQIGKIQEVVRQEELAFKGSKEQRIAYNREVEGLAKAQIDGLYIDNKALVDNNAASMQEVADKAWTTYMAMEGAPEQYSVTTRLRFKEIAKAAEDAANDIQHPFETAFKSLASAVPSLIQSAFTGGGGIAGAGRAIGSAVGSSIGGGVVADLTKNSAAFMGTALGKMVGSAIPIIGALAGPLIEAFFKMFDHVADDVSRDVSQKFGTKLGKATLDAIVAAVKGGQQEVVAEMINLNKIIADAGGLSSSNLGIMEARLRDVFALIQAGTLTSAQGTKILNENWDAFVKASVSGVGLIDTKLLEMIELQRKSGLESKAMTDYVAGQAGTAAGKFTAALKIPADALATYDALNAKQLAAAASGAKLNEVTLNGKTFMIALTQAEFDQMNVAGQLYDTTRIKSQAAASAVGAALTGTFNAMIASGSSFNDALAAIAPAIDELQGQLTATGFTGGAAFDLLLGQVNLAKDAIAGPALSAVNNLSGGMVALTNAGGMTQDTFSGLAGQIEQTFESLVAGGHDGKDVLLAMQNPLQILWEEQQEFGYKVDDATQALIDEAEKAGIVGEKHKSSTDQMIDALGILHTDLQGIVDALTGKGGVSDAFVTLGAKAKAAIDAIPRSYTLEVTENVTTYRSGGGDNPDMVSTGGRVTQSGVSYFSGGGNVLNGPWQAQGTDTVRAMLTPGEGVVSTTGMDSLTSEGLRSINAGGGLPATPEVVAAIQGLQLSLMRQAAMAEASMARAVRDEVQKVRKQA